MSFLDDARLLGIGNSLGAQQMHQNALMNFYTNTVVSDVDRLAQIPMTPIDNSISKRHLLLLEDV